MSKAVLRLDGLIFAWRVDRRTDHGHHPLINDDSQEAIYWGGGWLATLAYTWLLDRSWGDER